MRSTTIALVFGLAGLAAGSLLSSRAAAAAAAGYGEDRAQIEDLQARYHFALDFHDPQLYASTWFFTKRTIFNEGSARWQYKGDRNPAW